MEKKIEDYLHLYFGCEIQYEEILGNWVHGQTPFIKREKLEWGFITWRLLEKKEIKLLLRPLSSITKEELTECFKIELLNPNEYLHESKKEALYTKYFLSKGFDVR